MGVREAGIGPWLSKIRIGLGLHFGGLVFGALYSPMLMLWRSTSHMATTIRAEWYGGLVWS